MCETAGTSLHKLQVSYLNNTIHTLADVQDPRYLFIHLLPVLDQKHINQCSETMSLQPYIDSEIRLIKPHNLG